MLVDALLDLTNRDEIVLDPFLGSGSTLIACEKTGRICRGLELDPLYADVIIRRFEAATGVPAVLEETGERFADLAARRQREKDMRGGQVGGVTPNESGAETTPVAEAQNDDGQRDGR